MDFIIQSDKISLDEEKDVFIGVLNKQYNKFVHQYTLAELHAVENAIEIPENRIPVGTIQFVRAILKAQGYLSVLKPLEVPPFLREDYILKRSYRILPFKELPKNGMYFIKDVSSLKCFEAKVQFIEKFKDWVKEQASEFNTDYTNHLFLISEPLSIVAEYRILVCRDEVVGVQYYNGSILDFPDKEFILQLVQMIKEQRNSGMLVPTSYTLDLGINEKGESFLIEMHNFVSCGTYGFEGDDLITMYRDGIDYEKEFSKLAEDSDKRIRILEG